MAARWGAAQPERPRGDEQLRGVKARHGAAARAAGASNLPLPVKGLMRVAADVMRFVAYRI